MSIKFLRQDRCGYPDVEYFSLMSFDMNWRYSMGRETTTA